jgi:hypothetical protein
MVPGVFYCSQEKVAGLPEELPVLVQNISFLCEKLVDEEKKYIIFLISSLSSVWPE